MSPEPLAHQSVSQASASTQAVILGSGRGIRRLDASRSAPSSLQMVQRGGTVLDWTLHALWSHGVGHITYVGGYQIQKVIERYPTLSYRYHAAWQQEGELAALLMARPLPDFDWVILRSTTVTLAEALARLSRGGGAAAVGQYVSQEGRGFAGMMFVARAHLMAAYDAAERLVARDRRASLDQWVAAMAADAFPTVPVDLAGVAAPVGDRLALARIVFSNKARTLERIQPLVRQAVILDQVRFSVGDWRHDARRIMEAVTSAFSGRQVVVRSSAHAEDGLEESLAGRFCSVLDVPIREGDRLREAIEQVVESYASDGRTAHAGDEVFVQPQVGDLAASGVLLTRDLETGAPYYVLNLDRMTGRSNAVTSGSQAALETRYICRWAPLASLPEHVRRCVSIGRELEELMHVDGLDIELGVDHAGRAYVFQVRPLPMRARAFELADDDLQEELVRVRDFLEGHLQPHPHLYGSTTLFSTMSDWNPAEMIGIAPRPLALSLYQRLVGGQAWAEARALLGYRDVRPEPLIVSVAGRPYVDVRASLNSFLPADLEPEIAERWVEHGLRLLRDNPTLHDKVEFEIALTCLTVDAEDQAARLRAAGLTAAEVARFQAHLLALTDRILRGDVEPIERQAVSLEQLAPRREKLLAERGVNATVQARQILYLLDDCERFGLVPFSVLARYAFIAMSLLRSFRTVGVFTAEEYDAVLRSIPTVATELSRDLARHAAGELTSEAVLARYGHLRPSSYDITSPNYAAAPELYLPTPQRRAAQIPDGPERRVAVELFDARAEAIERLLRAQGFSARPDQVRDFILRSIPARERAKFIFMQNVNALLEAIGALGERLGFDREGMSFVPVERIARGATDSPTGAARAQLKREIEFARKRWQLTCAVRLPHLLASPDELDAFALEEWTPNFVSSRRVTAAPAVLDGRAAPGDLAGRIVLIRAADPGFDWIFGHPIAGLVTQHGGVASHMAIRAAEFGLPAAIGCGELIFERLRHARLIELDAMHRQIRAIP